MTLSSDEILNSLPSGVLILRPTGQVLFANPAAKALLAEQAEVGGQVTLPITPGSTTELDVNGRVVRCNPQAIQWAGEAALLVTLDDVSELSNTLEALQRTASELNHAFDTTIDNLAQALDLRDKEMPGHSQRVSDLTVRMARALGVGEGDLVHIRRGALLHDIGKLSVPDRILLKHDPLTSEEWDVMRTHTVVGHDLLANVDLLKPAAEIPYSHHEKWDGTGYPRGLQGEEIPLAARIFAVADVWDALRSERPYRRRWPEEKARDYIMQQAGKHFDPKVVGVFVIAHSEQAPN